MRDVIEDCEEVLSIIKGFIAEETDPTAMAQLMRTHSAVEAAIHRERLAR